MTEVQIPKDEPLTSLDKGEGQLAEEALRRRLGMQQLVAQLATRFVAVSPGEVDHEIALALAAIGRLTGADHTYITFLSLDAKRMDDAFEWHSSNVEPRAQNMRGLAVSRFRWAMAKLNRGEVMYAPSMSDLPPEATAERATWEAQGIHATLAIPLAHGESLAGFFGLASEKAGATWADDDIELLKLVGDIIVTVRDRARAQLAAEQSRQLYEVLATSIDGIIWEADTQTGEFSFVSQRAERLLGYPRRSWLEEASFWPDHLHPDDRDRVLQFSRQMIDQKKPHHIEYRMLAADGRVVWLRDIVAVVVDNDTAVKMCGVMVDITERKQAEEALRRRSEQLEALRYVGMEIAAQLGLNTLLHSIVAQAVDLLQGVAGGFYFYRPDSDVLEWKVAVGLDRAPIGTVLKRGEGLSGKVWASGRPAFVDDYEAWEGRASIYEGYSFKAVVAAPLYWGDEFLGVINVQASPGRTYSTDDAELLSLFAAQSAIAMANARLFEAEQRRRQEAEALRQASLALGSTLDTGRIVDCVLEQIARVLPYESANVMWIEDGVARVIKQCGYERAGTAEATATLRFVVDETPNLCRLATTRRAHIVPDTHADPDWVLIPATAWIRSWAGAPIVVRDQVLGFFSLDSQTPGFYTADHADLLGAMTAHASIAIENARLYENLQQRMDELQRTQAQLVQSAKMAAVGELAAGVAHELNNPLTAVLGFAELMMWTIEAGNPMREDLSTIVSEARRARDIVRALLDFSRQSESYFRQADLNQVMRETLALVRRQIGNSRVSLSEDYAPELPLLSLSPGHIKQVLLNLLTNALQAMPDGGRLTIRTERIGDEVAVHVADTGVGIPIDHQARIFDPFFTTKPAGHGTGLGLSVSLGIVQEHAGRITLESEVGMGTTFTVWLPVTRAPQEATHGR